MQARAEAAERERDYWQKLHDERTAFLGQCATEKEAAEARVKELEEALVPFARIAEMEKTTLDGTSVMVNVSRCRAARTALKGGSNG
jgi:hypothetical protein